MKLIGLQSTLSHAAPHDCNGSVATNDLTIQTSMHRMESVYCYGLFIKLWYCAQTVHINHVMF